MRKSKPPAEELDEDGQDSDGTYWGEWDEICDYGISSENAELSRGDGTAAPQTHKPN